MSAIIIHIPQISWCANDPKAFYKSTKVLVDKIKPMIQAVLKDIPSTSSSAYNEHKIGLEAYLKKLEESKRQKIPCFFKTFGIMNDFVDLLTPYEKENAPKEAKEVYKLFNKHGFAELDKEIIKVALAFDLSKLGNDLEKFANSKDVILTEQC